MAHIKLPEGLPGIRGPMAFRPETAKPLNELADVLLHAPNSLTPGDASSSRHMSRRATIAFSAKPYMAPLPRIIWMAKTRWFSK